MKGAPDKDKISAMLLEIKKLFEDHALEDPAIATPFMERAAAVREEIHKTGLFIKVSVSLNFKACDIKAKVDVELLPPKGDASTETKALYDSWFLSRTGIKAKDEDA